jgi:uncharacterized protein
LRILRPRFRVPRRPCTQLPEIVDIVHAISPGDLGVLALGLVIAGVVGGLVAGVLGIGGGIVMVPVLYHILSTLGLDQSIRMHVAVGTSLAAAIPAALARLHGSEREIDWLTLRRRFLPLITGIAAGSTLMALSNGHMLAVIFAVVAAPVVLELAFGGRADRWIAPAAEGPAGLFCTALLGFAATITGMGGTTLALSVLRAQQLPPLRAAATASLFGLVVGIPASIGAVLAGWQAQLLPPVSLGYVNLLAFALIAPILLLMEPAGAMVAHIIDLKRLRLVFAALIAIITARMLWDALG